jgi:hypothetical protein
MITPNPRTYTLHPGYSTVDVQPSAMKAMIGIPLWMSNSKPWILTHCACNQVLPVTEEEERSNPGVSKELILKHRLEAKVPNPKP